MCRNPQPEGTLIYILQKTGLQVKRRGAPGSGQFAAGVAYRHDSVG